MQYDIAETINKMDALSKKMKEMATSQKQIQINRSDNGGLKDTKAAQPKTSYITKSAVGYSDSLMQTIEETKKQKRVQMSTATLLIMQSNVSRNYPAKDILPEIKSGTMPI